MSMPREIFEDFVSPLQETDAEGLRRAPDGSLLPTSSTQALKRYKYTVKKGSVIDKLFKLQELDPDPPLPPPEPEVEEIGQNDVYEVETIVRSRKRGNRGPST